jgi:NitT/TauT family transport system permease protein
VWLIFSAPIVSLYPVFLLIFGLGTTTIITIAFLLTVSTIIVNTMRGVQHVDPKLIQAARAFLASDRQIFRHVAIPAAVPMIMAGLRIGVGRALTGVIVAEFFVGEGGIGYQAYFFAGKQETANMLANIVVIAALGVLVTQLLRLAESRADRWRIDAGSR